MKAMGKAGRDELHRRMRDTRRARGFQLIHDWSKRTTGGKIHVIFQWFLHSSPADLSGLMDAVHARLWCECACSRQMPRARRQLQPSPYLLSTALTALTPLPHSTLAGPAARNPH